MQKHKVNACYNKENEQMFNGVVQYGRQTSSKLNYICRSKLLKLLNQQSTFFEEERHLYGRLHFYLFNTSNNTTTICLHIITYATLLMHIITLNNAVSSLLMGHVCSKQTYYKNYQWTHLHSNVYRPYLGLGPRFAHRLLLQTKFASNFKQPPYSAFSRFKQFCIDVAPDLFSTLLFALISGLRCPITNYFFRRMVLS